MQTTAVDHITIDLLTQKAGVTRNTFYYHFDDIYSLMEWTYRQELLANIDNYIKIKDWKVAYRLVLNYIEENRAFCLNTFRSVNRDLLEGMLYSVASELVRKVIDSAHRDISTSLATAIKNFYGWALVMQVIQWLADDLAEPKKVIVQRAELMLTGSIDNAIKNSEKLGKWA